MADVPDTFVMLAIVFLVWRNFVRHRDIMALKKRVDSLERREG